MSKTTVLSLGGSIIAPDKADSAFLKAFREAISAWLDQDRERRLILVCGGGAPARGGRLARRDPVAAFFFSKRHADDEQQFLNGRRRRSFRPFLLRLSSSVVPRSGFDFPVHSRH